MATNNPTGVPPEAPSPQGSVAGRMAPPRYPPPAPPRPAARPQGQAPAPAPQQPYQPPLAAPPPHRKSPGLHLLLSIFIPGLGTILNGERRKGLLILGVCVLCYLLIWAFPVLLIAWLGFFAWGLVDAYQGTKRHNALYNGS